jgi:hypothetical protein
MHPPTRQALGLRRLAVSAMRRQQSQWLAHARDHRTATQRQRGERGCGHRQRWQGLLTISSHHHPTQLSDRLKRPLPARPWRPSSQWATMQLRGCATWHPNHQQSHWSRTLGHWCRARTTLAAPLPQLHQPVLLPHAQRVSRQPPHPRPLRRPTHARPALLPPPMQPCGPEGTRPAMQAAHPTRRLPAWRRWALWAQQAMQALMSHLPRQAVTLRQVARKRGGRSLAQQARPRRKGLNDAQERENRAWGARLRSRRHHLVIAENATLPRVRNMKPAPCPAQRRRARQPSAASMLRAASRRQ